MDIMKIKEKNRINNEIISIQKCIDRNDETISRLRGTMDNNLEYNLNHIKKLEDGNLEKEINLDILNKRLLELEEGTLNKELISQYSTNEQEIKKKANEKQQKKLNDNKLLEEHKISSKKFHKDQSDEERRLRYLEKESARALQYFYKIQNGLPTYMMNKLSNMPNNKGYIWKGVHFYGLLPAEPNEPLVIFENMRDDVLRIHETNEKEYLIFEKSGKNRKRLVSKTNRKNTNGSGIFLSSYF